MRLTRFSGKASGRHLASACPRALGAIAGTVPRLPSPVDGQVPFHQEVPTAVPAKLSRLAAFAATNAWQTACDTLAEIRHGYVHSNKKRRQVVLSAPNLATFEAWQLSL